MGLPLIEVPKKAWMSKTLWANFLISVVAIVAVWVPAVANIVNEEAVLMLFAMVNMILRLVTKDKVVLW